MASKLIPKNPAEVTVTRQVVPNVITTFSAPFWRFGRIKIGGRGTVGIYPSGNLSLVYTPFTDRIDLVRLQSGALAVFSPVALTDEVKETVAKLGEVKYITALDIEVRKISYTIFASIILILRFVASYFPRRMARRLPPSQSARPRRPA